MRDEKKMEMMDTEMESAEFTCDDIFKRRFMPNLKDDDDYEEEDFG